MPGQRGEILGVTAAAASPSTFVDKSKLAFEPAFHLRAIGLVTMVRIAVLARPAAEPPLSTDQRTPADCARFLLNHAAIVALPLAVGEGACYDADKGL